MMSDNWEPDSFFLIEQGTIQGYARNITISCNQIIN